MHGRQPIDIGDGAAGKTGSIERIVTRVLLDRRFPVRARVASRRATGAELLGRMPPRAEAGLGVICHRIVEQSQFLALMDCFRVIGWIALAMIPLVLAIRKLKPSSSGASVH